MADYDVRLTRTGDHERGPTFVGRAQELTELRALHDRVALERNGHVSLVTGPAGVGKTRLVSELASKLRASGAPVFEGACRDGGLAYQPFVELAQAMLAHIASEGPGGERLARAAEVVAA